MKKPVIKALAMTMAITMALSTPLTASAAGLADLYGTTGTQKPETPKPPKLETPNVETPGVNTPNVETIGAPEIGEIEGEVTITGIVLDQNVIEVPVGYESDVSATVIVDTNKANVLGKSMTLSINDANAEQYDGLTIIVVDSKGNRIEYKPEDLLKNIKWELKDNKVASIKKKADKKKADGIVTVTGKKGGNTSLIATISGTDYSATADVKVTAYTTSITLRAPKQNFAKQQINLNSLITERKPEGANDAITWKVYETGKLGRNTSYASIKDDILTLKKATPSGKSITVIATTEQGATGSIAFAIEAGNPITKLVKGCDTKQELTIKQSDPNPTREIKVKIDKVKDNSSPTTDFITWTSKNPLIASVSPKTATNEGPDNPVFGESLEATIKAHSVGKTTITATSTSGKKVNFTVTVKAPVEKITGIKVVDRGNTVYLGQKVQLEAIVEPANADPKEIKKIKFTLVDSTDRQYATVSTKGVVQANKKGKITEGTKTVNVKATYKENKNAQEVNWTQNDFIKIAAGDITSFALSPSVIPAFYVNQNTRIKTIDISPAKDEAALKECEDMFIWSTNKAKVVTVDQNGNIKAVAPGSAKITATTYYMDARSKLKTVKKTVNVTVKQPVESIQLNKTDVTVNYNKTSVTKDKNYSVTLEVSKRFPKNADKKEEITWNLVGVTKDGKGVSDADHGVTVDSKKGKVTIPAAKNLQGTVIKVQAQSALGAKAVATITVCDATKNVTTTLTRNKADLKISGTSNTQKYKLDDKYIVNAKDTSAICKEQIVSYTANNKNVRIAKESDGYYYVYALKAGKSVVTAKTASGKSEKITFTITEE